MNYTNWLKEMLAKLFSPTTLCELLNVWSLKEMRILGMAIPGFGDFKKGYKIINVSAKNQLKQIKILNFEDLSDRELSKIGHHFRK